MYLFFKVFAYLRVCAVLCVCVCAFPFPVGRTQQRAESREVCVEESNLPSKPSFIPQPRLHTHARLSLADVGCNYGTPRPPSFCLSPTLPCRPLPPFDLFHVTNSHTHLHTSLSLTHTHTFFPNTTFCVCVPPCVSERCFLLQPACGR